MHILHLTQSNTNAIHARLSFISSDQFQIFSSCNLVKYFPCRQHSLSLYCWIQDIVTYHYSEVATTLGVNRGCDYFAEE